MLEDLGKAAEGGCAYTPRKDGSEALCPTENFGTSASVFHERPASPCQQPRSKPSHSSSLSFLHFHLAIHRPTSTSRHLLTAFHLLAILASLHSYLHPH